MKNCPNCGAQIPNDSTFCTYCGSVVAQEQSAPMNQTQTNPNVDTNNQGMANPNMVQNNQGMVNPNMVQNNQQQFAGQQPFTSQGMDTTTDKAIAVLAYIIPLIPYLMKPKTDFGKFHAAQGLNVWILSIIYAVLKSVVSNFVPGIISTLLGLGSIFFTVMYIIGLVYACQGKVEELPVVSNLKIIKY